MNNRTWYYDLTRPQPGQEDSPLRLKDRQYLGGVKSIKLNAEYSSVLYDGKIQLHMVLFHISTIRYVQELNVCILVD